MTKEEQYEDVTELDLVFEAHDKVDALITLLIEKGVFTEDEYEKRLSEILEQIEEGE